MRNLPSTDKRFPGPDAAAGVTLVGFSKGGVVLNQLLYAFYASLESSDEFRFAKGRFT